jgi:site-specific DNA-methyltransferase (adenine-specific)
VLPSVTADALVTDPPYGVNLGDSDKRGGRNGLAMGAYASYDDSYENFIGIVVPALNGFLDTVQRGAVFTGPHIHEQRKPDAIGGVYCPAGAGRHCWGFKTFLPVLLYGTAPDLNLGQSVANTIRSSELPNRAETGDHPVPKPLGWMRWLVQLASRPRELVIDPFMGSGTTLRAAKDLGRKAIGIEIEERYCEIAAKRLAQETLFGAGMEAR